MNENWLKSAGLNHFWMIWRFKFLLKQLSKIKIKFKKKYKIMDLGCGNGILSNQIEKNNLLKIDRVDSNYETLKLNKDAKGKIFNLGSGKGIKIKNLIKFINKKIKKGTPLFGKIQLRSDESLEVRPDLKRIKKILKWKPQFSLERGLKRTIKSYE